MLRVGMGWEDRHWSMRVSFSLAFGLHVRCGYGGFGLVRGLGVWVDVGGGAR